MKDLTEGFLADQLAYAETIGDETLANCIQQLKNADEYNKSETIIGKDFAPRSFEFARMKEGRCIINGGIIFHGAHDGGGNGSSPSFSVSISNNNKSRWELHT
jgi:hypothetical protein